MRIGVDVGGTFTDLVGLDHQFGLRYVKTPSTPADPGLGVMTGLSRLALRFGLDLTDLLKRTDLLIHGTTVATNILVQRSGARVGLITTEGFRDLLELREGTKANRYRLREPFPAPLIPRSLRLEVPERIRADGSIETPLDRDAVEAAIAELRAADIEAVVVCFLHSHRNPTHELRVAETISEIGWSPFVTLSHQILPREGEYDRLSSSVANAYVGPGLDSYLGRLSDRLADEGVASPLMIMQSNGGVVLAAKAAQRAVNAVTSGPAGGALAAVAILGELGESRAITFDTGGTSTDICIIEDGIPVETQTKVLLDTKIAVPAIEVNPLALGGGSIARVRTGGILDLGPQSAGADPGPACFDRGGTLPTLTDANLVLGYISPQGLLSGELALSRSSAVAALEEHVAAPLGLDVETAALAIHRLATSRITEGVRLATVRRGSDPRDHLLLSFGGAGGLHAAAVAREIGMPRTVIPRQASVLSALGFLSADLRQDAQRAIGRAVGDLSGLAELCEELAVEGRRSLEMQGFSRNGITIRLIADCRYARQIHTLPVQVDPDWLPEEVTARLATAFVSTYDARYGHHHPGELCVVETLRAAAFGQLPGMELPRLDPQEGQARSRHSRAIYLGGTGGGWREVSLYKVEELGAGARIAGAALLESESTTILLHDGDTVEVDAWGCLHITRPAESLEVSAKTSPRESARWPVP